MEYIIKYRYKKMNIFDINYEWKEKEYIARDKNDLIEKINSSIRRYAELYIIDIKEVKEKEK